MSFWQLPNGWEWKPISSIVAETERRNPTQAPEQSFYYIDVGSVDNARGEIELHKVNVLLGKDAPSRARKVVKKGDVIFATVRPYLRNIAIIPEALDNQICSTGFCVLHPKSGFTETRYIYHACRSDFFVNQLIKKQRGASYPAVTDGDVLGALVPIPFPNDLTRSIAIQNRIVARIEALVGEVNELHRLQEDIKASTIRLISEIINEAFREGISQGWAWTTIGELILGQPQYGTSQKANLDGVGLPILRMGNIQDGELNFDDLKYVNSSQRDKQRYTLKLDDIIFNRTNSAELVGKTAVFYEDQPMVFASYLIRMTPNLEKADPEYVSLFINSAYGRKYIASQYVRAIGQVNVNAQKLKAMPIPVPPYLDEQKRFVQRIRKAKAEISEMKLINDSDARLVQDLENAILVQAFRGEV